MPSRKKRRKSKPDEPSLAAQACKYRCYGLSVQEPEHEVDFFDARYREFFGRTPLVLREDFCGTFAVCCEWVKSHQNRTALGVDLDPEPLAWGREHLLSQLDADQRDRVTLMERDVREHVAERPHLPRAEILAAQNFSFWLFTTREELLAYFRAAHRHLADEGLMVMDMMGGSECMEEDREDVRKIEGYAKPVGRFKYIWRTDRVNPVTMQIQQSISFRFADGTRIEPAFEYHWRMWSIAEVRELLAEAGFSESHVYWAEYDEEEEEETGEWFRTEDAPADPSWVAYIVARR